jgi:hypothetical protein
MPKLSSAVAISALLMALSAPSFAADLNSSTPQRNSTTIQNRDQLNAGVDAGVNTRSGTSTRMNDRDNDRDDVNSSTSLNSKSTLDRDRDRPQSAQMPNADRDANGRGRSSTSPGHEMQENGSVPGSPGASGYAPGHR